MHRKALGAFVFALFFGASFFGASFHGAAIHGAAFQVATASAQPGMTPAPSAAPHHASDDDADVDLEPYTRSIVIADAVTAGFWAAATFLAVPCFDNAFVDDPTGDEDTSACLWMAGSLIAGMGTYVLASPVIHSRRGNSRGAGFSFALRLTVPLAGFAAASLIDQSPGSIGIFLTSLATPMVIDWFVLSRPKRLPVAPLVTPMPGGGLQAGLGGTF